MTFTLLRRGQLIAAPPPEVALRFLEREERARQDDRDRVPGQQRSGRRAVIGAPATVRAELEEVAASYSAEEVIAVNITYDHHARMRSYELLAEVFRL